MPRTCSAAVVAVAIGASVAACFALGYTVASVIYDRMVGR